MQPEQNPQSPVTPPVSPSEPLFDNQTPSPAEPSVPPVPTPGPATPPPDATPPPTTPVQPSVFGPQAPLQPQPIDPTQPQSFVPPTTLPNELPNAPAVHPRHSNRKMMAIAISAGVVVLVLAVVAAVFVLMQPKKSTGNQTDHTTMNMSTDSTMQ